MCKDNSCNNVKLNSLILHQFSDTKYLVALYLIAMK